MALLNRVSFIMLILKTLNIRYISTWYCTRYECTVNSELDTRTEKFKLRVKYEYTRYPVPVQYKEEFNKSCTRNVHKSTRV